MRFRTLTIAAALAAGISSTGDAYAPQKGADRPVVAAGRAPRLHRDVTFTPPVAAALSGLPGWRTMWDRDTDVPLRLWGPSIAAPGTSHDASTAEQFARKQLAEHLHLLAPGATATDFVLVSNQLSPSGDIRSVGFLQYAHGLPVVGGSIAFTFSHDRLVMMGSTALPRVVVRMPHTSLPLATISSAARNWLASAGYDTEIKAHESRVIVPLVRSRGNGTPSIEYRVAETVVVEGTLEPGAWSVWIDANDGSPIARKTHLHWASGKVLFDTPDRYPAGTRSAKPAPGAQHQVAGAMAMSGLDGSVTWASGSATVVPGLVGPQIRVSNKAGALATDTLTLSDGGTITWSKATDEFADAQLTAFVATAHAKQFTRDKLNAELGWLNSQIPVVVNESQTCNAYSTGNDIHFFRRNTKCENTGRLVDVVYHEFGHSLHAQSIIPGVGSFDGALSEGLSDTLAAAITRDHGMGRGFFHTSAPLRDLDPAGYEMKWPDDATGQVHNDGEIIGGTLWDLRKALEAKLGQAAGDAQLRKIFYSIMQRASDIPSSYLEALLADDNDGNLANGTPNECLINEAFGAHGLADPSVTLGLEPPLREGYRVSIKVPVLQQQRECPPPAVSKVTVLWTPSAGNGGEIALTASGETWAGQIPTQPDGTVIKYKVIVTLADGSSLSYPQNKADPEYQMYVGNVEKIWCADFENGLGDWTKGGTPANAVEWEAGAPMGIAGDPKSAFAGNGVLGIDLGGDDGLYSPETTQFVESPEIDLEGHTNVRLQYYRWLNVEDGVFDPAVVQVNGTTVWQNKTSPSQDDPGPSHTDREWRFHDVDLAAYTGSGKVKLKFQITSDGGLELGGWTMDQVCLVRPGAPSNHCGNGNLDGEEVCDDGNSVDGDGCSATCQPEDGDGGGCCSAGTNPAGPLALALMTLGLVLLRRRRR